MGRYYSGDINGKFWFGIQNSDDAEQFGARIEEASFIQYYADDIKPCRKRCDEIFSELQVEPRYNFKTEDEIESFVIRLYNEQVYSNELLASLELGLKLHRMLRLQDDVYFEALR